MPLHEDEGGCQLRFRFIRDGEVADISTATTKEVWILKPGGTWTLLSAVFVTNGTDGQIGHTLTAAEQDTPGLWKAQGFVELSGYSKWSDVETFLVKQNKP